MNPDYSLPVWSRNRGTLRSTSTQLIAGWIFGFWVKTKVNLNREFESPPLRQPVCTGHLQY